MRKGEFAQDAQKAGIDTLEIQSGFPLRDFLLAKEAARQFQPDIVHCHGAKANTVGTVSYTHLSGAAQRLDQRRKAAALQGDETAHHKGAQSAQKLSLIHI